MATVANQIQKIYIGLLGRAADAEGLAYWTDEIESGALTLEQLRANIVEEQPEYLQGMGQMTRAQVVNQLYQNLFNRSAEPEGLDYWVNGGGSSVNVDQLVLALVDGAQAADTLALDNKTVIAEYYTQAAGENYSEAAARAAIANVDGSTDLAAARAAVDALLEGPASAETLTLTQRADDLQGADGVDTTFTAPVTQNETGSGALANTFETGDVLDGGADSRNILQADLIASGSIGLGGFQSPAISAETTNIQEVYFRAQNVQGFDQGSNTTAVATIDAEKMVGVEQWWTDNSRADVIIEDVRSRPVDTTLGMRNTDPEVGFEVYFNPLFMDGGQSSQSQLVIQIAELDGGVVNADAELQNISVSALSFELDGEAVTLSSDAMAAANTWEELEAAIVEALEAEGLGDLQVTRGNNGEFLLFDAEGRPFSNQGGFTASATTDQQIDIRNRITQDLQTEDEQTETTLVLDGAGNGSRGGNVNIAAMSGDRGVEVFNVQVDNDSHIRTLRSENNPNNTGSYAQEQQLEEVYLTHVDGGAQGALQLGSRTVEQSGVSTTTDDRLVTDGLLDVRVFDAAGYAADIKLGASLTEAVFDKYLAGAEEPVQFSYLLGDGNNNLSLFVDNDVASDPDFALEIIGGAGDDRINLTGLQYKNSTSIDGAEGSNIVEVNTTTGAAAGGNTAAENSWASFENIQTLVVAGNNNTTQNLVVGNMGSLEQVVIATGNVDTNVQQMRMDQDLTISGKNQTLGQGNSNEDQDFGIVTISNTSAVPGVGSFEVLLDNTARVDGELTVADLVVNGANSDIRTLDVVSSGRRETANVVNAFNGEAVTTLNLVGSQDLSFHVETMATQPTTGGTPPLTINGADLGGDLVLAIDAANLVRENQDVITGAAGENDVLQVYGAIDTNAVVSAFETVQFGAPFAAEGAQASGTYNAANTTGVDLYNVVALGDALTIENLRSEENVRIDAVTADDNVTLNAASRGLENTLNVTIDSSDGGVYSSELAVNDFRTINLTLESAEGAVNTFSPDLILNGYVSGGDDFANYARTLTVSGGDFDGAGANRTNIDQLNVNELSHSLSVIDLSGFQGNVTGSFGDVLDEDGNPYADQQDFNSNTVIRVSEFDFTWDQDAVSDLETVTTFRFTADAYADTVVWQIDDFKSFGTTNDLGNLDILDLRDLGIEGLSDISIVQDGTDVTITSNGDQNFTIELTGVADALSNENFIFAS